MEKIQKIRFLNYVRRGVVCKQLANIFVCLLLFAPPFCWRYCTVVIQIPRFKRKDQQNDMWSGKTRVEVECQKVQNAENGVHQERGYHQRVEDVSEFVYLGAMVDREGGGDRDIKNMLQKAREAFHRLARVWNTRVIGRKTKIHLFNTLVRPVLLYGCETWKITKKDEKRLDTFQVRCLRRIFRIRYGNKGLPMLEYWKYQAWRTSVVKYEGKDGTG